MGPGPSAGTLVFSNSIVPLRGGPSFAPKTNYGCSTSSVQSAAAKPPTSGTWANESYGVAWHRHGATCQLSVSDADGALLDPPTTLESCRCCAHDEALVDEGRLESRL